MKIEDVKVGMEVEAKVVGPRNTARVKVAGVDDAGLCRLVDTLSDGSRRILHRWASQLRPIKKDKPCDS